MHQYAARVRDGIDEDPTFLPVIYSAPQDADWTDEEVWKACNPALGDFRGIAEMRDFARKAKVVPSLQNTFRQLYPNQWTEQASRWLDMFAWRKCKGNVSERDLAGLPCFGGLDLSQSDDLSAFVRLWCHPDGRKFVRANFWIPQAAIERFKPSLSLASISTVREKTNIAGRGRRNHAKPRRSDFPPNQGIRVG